MHNIKKHIKMDNTFAEMSSKLSSNTWHHNKVITIHRN